MHNSDGNQQVFLNSEPGRARVFQCMPKANGKGRAFDKPGPSSKFKASRRAAARSFAERMSKSRDPREQAMLDMVARCDGLALDTRKHFEDGVRSALRRVRDGPAATPCSNYAKKHGACPKCTCVAPVPPPPSNGNA